MTTTVLERRPKALPRRTKPAAAKTMYAAVVHDFERPLQPRRGRDADRGAGRDRRSRRSFGPLPHRHPRRARRLAGQADAAVHAGTRGCRDRRGARSWGDRGRPRRPCRDSVARVRLRNLRLLRERLGDPLPRAEEHGLLPRRLVRGLCKGVRPVRRQGARGRRSRRCRTAHVRRRDDVQGDQGRRNAAVRSRRDLRRRRARPSRDPVRGDRRWPRRRGRSGRREARAGEGSSERSSR